ncbi:MAG: NAD(P)-dependent oxidoreductase [Pyrinomonadaceae bacterium]|nr:NAD(P)-dependent oxidoreductase [Pyrinomonadaceae bacterium]MBP6213372.1 NAD(P)-dependent oxidoreductase [Pyrinomonadaceae bacterium]
MKRVLLTGASGFVGRTTIKYLLQRGYEVHGVTARSAVSDIPGIVCHDVDLLDSAAVDRLIRSVNPSHLLHFAWYVEHGKFWNAPENNQWVAASERLFESFVSAGGNRIVSAGTCAEYDWQTGNGVFQETTSPIGPDTLYGQAKHELHMRLETIARKTSVSYAWGRVFFLFGEWEQPGRFVPFVIRSLLNDDEAKCSSGEQIRDFMFVEDAGAAFVDLLDSDVGGAVNIGSGVSTKLADVAVMIAEIIGKPELLRLGAIPNSAGEPKQLVADITRLRDEVEFKPQTDLRSALAETIDWWRDQK